ncbi:MAG: hypothetical protein ACI9FN_003031 [Saprospiraceae bacterium]|jgi:hypothetical protein
MIKDLVPGPTGYSIASFYDANNRIFFLTILGLYVSDGTSEGTVLIYGIDNKVISNLQDITTINDVLFFTAFVEGAGHQLIRSNGLKSGTGIVTASDILESGYDRYRIISKFYGISL